MAAALFLVEHHRLESLGHHCGRVQDRLDQVVPRELAARGTKVGPLLHLLGIDRVAGHAGKAGEQLLSERHLTLAHHHHLHHVPRIQLRHLLSGARPESGHHFPGPLRSRDQFVVVAVDGRLDLPVVAGQPEIGEGQEEAHLPRVVPRDLHCVFPEAFLDERAVCEGQDRPPGEATHLGVLLARQPREIVQIQDQGRGVDEIGYLALGVLPAALLVQPPRQHRHPDAQGLLVVAPRQGPVALEARRPGPFRVEGRVPEQQDLPRIGLRRPQRNRDRIVPAQLQLRRVDPVLRE